MFVARCVKLLVLFATLSLSLTALAQSRSGYTNKLPNTTISKIAFGCCAEFKNRQAVWFSVNRFAPDLFIFMGDNVLADTDDMDDLKFAYSKLQQHRGFRILKRNSILMHIWDDQDYGEIDADKYFRQKRASRQAFLEFWREPMISPRYIRDTGLNYSLHFGKEDQRVQVIILDTRWNRDPVKKVSLVERAKRVSNKQGPYIAQEGRTMLSPAQWQWLADELREYAQLRIIVSTTQMLPEFNGHDNWAIYPDDQKKLFSLLKKGNIRNTMLLGGGTHWAEISSRQDIVDYPLYEITPGSLTEDSSRPPKNRYRRGKVEKGPAYGTIEIEWQKEDPEVTITTRQAEGKTVNKRTFALSHLQ